DSECISFAQRVRVTATGYYGDYLQESDKVDDAKGRTEASVRSLEPRVQHAVFSNPIHDAIGTDNRRVHGSRQNQNAANDNEDVEPQTKQLRTHQKVCKSTQEVVCVSQTHIIRNDHGCQQCNDAGRNDCVSTNDGAGAVEALQFRIRDLSINLRERLETA